MDQAFQVAIPLIGNIQADIGTLLTSIILLMFICAGFDFVIQMMMAGRENRNLEGFLESSRENAQKYDELADTFADGSWERDYNDQLSASYRTDAIRAEKKLSWRRRGKS